LLALVTMRGEWGEFNPWQIPMGQATPGALELAGVRVMRAERPEEAADVVQAAAVIAYEAGAAAAVLLSQRLIGAKVFMK
jgi:sulfopyruvate decarboxylase TPP-binding subunit